MIKVFTSNESPQRAGDELTSKIDKWISRFHPNTIKILDVHTNSNEFGWMIVIIYEVI